ncbi:MAG: nucleotide sugar dehydrogenase [Patescibacteria group bacterium]
MPRHSTKTRIAVVGLGYVGLPLAVRFAQAGIPVLGFDVSQARISALEEHQDSTNEVSPAELKKAGISYSSDPSSMANSNFIIIAVPTPVTAAKQPDLEPVRSAARLVGAHMKTGTVVVLESTVYPGVTEDIMGPILAEASGLKLGKDFAIGYSPERANPGDTEHTVDKITKIVSGMDEATLNKVDEVYKVVCLAGTHRAATIQTAEAAKVIENIQRDLNIALMNELSMIFQRLGLRTHDVLEAAGTKWNFHKYAPGLVGGHCIPVDPYYLTHLAETIGYHPQVILAGRKVNDGMAGQVAQLVIRGLIETGRVVKGARVLVLGATFKENVNDTRNSKVSDVIRELGSYGVEVFVHDPLLTEAQLAAQFGGTATADLTTVSDVDAMVLTVAHDEITKQPLEQLTSGMRRPGVFIDTRGFYRRQPVPDGITYKTL